MKYTPILLLACGILSTLQANNTSSQLEFKLIDEGTVSADALWLTRYRFGPGLNVNRNSIQVHKGYIFVTWYQGGMDNRHMMLSRKKIGSSEWHHIKFPHRHVMFRGDKHLPEDQRRGDSHNTIAVGICPLDDSLHLIYDLHAYTPADFKDSYFNYNKSIKGAAIVPDAQWNLDLFSEKLNYLSRSARKKDYYRVTYPKFWVDRSDKLHVSWRVGGTHNAAMQLSTYDGENWSKPRAWNVVPREKSLNKGFYGQFELYNDKLFACWSRRSQMDVDSGYLASGLYLAESFTDTASSYWLTMDGQKSRIPHKDWEHYKIADPVKPGERLKSGPDFIVSQKGAFHGVFPDIAKSNGEIVTRHVYCRHKRETPVFFENNGVLEKTKIKLHEIGGHIFMYGLSAGLPQIKKFDLKSKSWKTVFSASGLRNLFPAGTQYRQCVITMDGDTAYFHLIKSAARGVDAVATRVVSIAPN